jgi:hypothetical protein
MWKQGQGRMRSQSSLVQRSTQPKRCLQLELEQPELGWTNRSTLSSQLELEQLEQGWTSRSTLSLRQGQEPALSR